MYSGHKSQVLFFFLLLCMHVANTFSQAVVTFSISFDTVCDFFKICTKVNKYFLLNI